jgi:hypothetical protein
MERGAKSAKAKVEARPTVTRKPRKVVAPTGLQVEQRLAEALEQHAAISEILRVISSSPGDVTPVLASVAERAAHLCGASFAQVLLVEGNVLRPTVAYWADAGADEVHDDSHGVKRTWPVTRNMLSGRAVLDCGPSTPLTCCLCSTLNIRSRRARSNRSWGTEPCSRSH